MYLFIYSSLHVSSMSCSSSGEKNCVNKTSGNYHSVLVALSLGSFTCRKAGTWDILFYFPSEGRHTENFPDARKIQRLRPGLNPRTRVPVASMLTTRPPKPSLHTTRINIPKFCMVITLRLCVLYDSQKKQSRLPCTSLIDWFFLTEMESV